MEPVEDIWSLKVEQLLGKIGHLTTLRNKEKSGEAAAILLQCEIFRTFALIDWINLLEGRKRQLEGQDSQPLEDLMARVTVERKEAGATQEDLQLMPIPEVRKPVLEKIVSGDYFPDYLQLPGPVVREYVYSCVSDARDKLNLIEAIPSDAYLMDWDKNVLRLEEIFSCMIERKVLDWKTAYNLSTVNQHFRDFFKVQLDNFLTNSLPNLELDEMIETVTPTELIQSTRAHENDPHAWYRFNPFPSKIYLDFSADEAEVAEQMQVLQQLGHKMWECTMYFKLGMPTLELFQRIISCLSLMPHLRFLHLTESFVPRWERPILSRSEIERRWRELENSRLPELTSLKVLGISGSGTLSFSLVTRKLLEKYAINLRQLKVSPEFPLQTIKLPAPRLSTLLIDYNGENDLTRCVNYVHMFADSPLKILSITPLRIHSRNLFPSLLLLLSKYFGETLEHLELQLDHGWNTHRPIPPPPSSTWMLDLNFPKLKYFGMDGFVYPGEFTFLLCFPALEKIYFPMVENTVEAHFAGEHILQLSFRRERMRGSNIWKLFPQLEKYELNGTSGYTLVASLFNITRKDCLAFQQIRTEIGSDMSNA